MVQSLQRSNPFRIAFDSPELLEVQRFSFNNFLKNGIPSEFSKMSPLKIEKGDITVELIVDGANFQLISPDENPRDCILKMKTYSCKLYVQATVVWKTISGDFLYQTKPEWVLVGHLPIMTKRGHFIINGSPRVIVHQVVRSPGIYFQEIIEARPKLKKGKKFQSLLHQNTKKRIRFYGDIIPRRGVWLRLQLTHKGRIEVKLKKGKKLPAQALQRCLEVLEKEEYSLALSSLSGKVSAQFDKLRCSQNAFPTIPNFISQINSKNGLSMTNTAQSIDNRDFVFGKEINDRIRFLKKKVVHRYFDPLSWPELPSKAYNMLAEQNSDFFQSKFFESIKLTQEKQKGVIYEKTSQGIKKKFSKSDKDHGHNHSKKSQRELIDIGTNPNKSRVNTELQVNWIRHNLNTGFTKKSDNSSQTDHNYWFLQKKKINEQCIAEDQAFSDTYNKLYRTAEEKEQEEWPRKRKNRAFLKMTVPDSSFKRKKCSKNLFETFKVGSRYDLSDLGREKINTKLGICVDGNQLTSLDINAASNWLYKLKKGEKYIDDIDHSQNRRIRTSGELLQTQFENGIDRLKKVAWNKLKEFATLQSNSSESINLRRPPDSNSKTAILESERLPISLKSSPQKNLQDVSESRLSGNRLSLQIPPINRVMPHNIQIDRVTSVSTQADNSSNRSTYVSHSLNPSVLRTSNSLNLSSHVDNASNRSDTQVSFADLSKQSASSFSKQIIQINRRFAPHLFQSNRRFAPENRRIYSSVPKKILVNPQGERYKFWDPPTLLKSVSNLERFEKLSTSVNRKGNSKSSRDDTFYSSFAQKEEKSGTNFLWDKTNAGHLILTNSLPPIAKLKSESNEITAFKEDQGKYTLNDLNKEREDIVQVIKQSTISIKELLNTKAINGALREFFGSNPLSQYMDQTNPLAEITHKRRISSLGAGGVSRDSAGMAIRGIHPTHYGRICPIETPEGKNAGLVNSLAFYAKIDEKGFIKTPYYKVVKGQVQEELGFAFLSAKEEGAKSLHIAASDLHQSWNNVLTASSVPARVADNLLDIFKKISLDQVDCIGISPIQMISVATSLIPFLEHNDANRALMGSNMQRQAVPLMIPERPVVGTGLESLVVAESGHLIQSKLSGFVSYVSADKIVVEQLSSLLGLKNSYQGNILKKGKASSIKPRKVSGTINKKVYKVLSHKNLLESLPGKKGLIFKRGSLTSPVFKLDINLRVRRGKRFWSTEGGWDKKILSQIRFRRQINLDRVSQFVFLNKSTNKRINTQKETYIKDKSQKIIFSLSKVLKSPDWVVRSPSNFVALRNTTLFLGRKFASAKSRYASFSKRRAFIAEKAIGVPFFSTFIQHSFKPSFLTRRVAPHLYQNNRVRSDLLRSQDKKQIPISPFKNEENKLTYLASQVPMISSPNENSSNKSIEVSIYGGYTAWPSLTWKDSRFGRDLSATKQALYALSESLRLMRIRCSQESSPESASKDSFSSSVEKDWACDQTYARNFDARNTFSGNEIQKAQATQLVPFIHTLKNFDRSNQDTCLTERALVSEGDWVQKGDILTDCSASDQGELAVGKNILIAYIPWEGYNFEDAIVISERLVTEDIYTSIHIERYDFTAQHLKEKTEWFTNDLPGISSQKANHLDEFGLPKIGSFVKEGDILVGKIQYSNKKPTTPYERLLCDILGEKNFSARDASLYVPKGVHARVIKHKVIGSFDNKSDQKSPQNGSPKLVHVFLGEKRPIQVGDKMSGRHGNKGVIATILPRQDMPYLADGTPIDIILNPLGVPSRMNVGQVFESLLGLAGTYLAQHFKITAFDELYGVEASQSLIYLKLYQARLQSGQNWLFQVDFPGKTRLIDGRSGESFDQWVTVGKAYMLKLIHMVSDKIHARETGPYALVTQQPLRGRAHQGGQRLGEMEVWALEAFGAAYTLQELLTKKSDDVHGRKEIATNILPRPVTVLDIIEPYSRIEDNKLILGHPEIFKVLICELQALCLDVGVYSLQPKAFQRIFLSVVE